MIPRFAYLFGNVLFFGFLLFSLNSCGDFIPPEEIKVNIDLLDPETRQLFSWQNQQKGDSLVAYFDHPKATYRYLAAQAFASIRQADHLEDLALLLQDPVDSVRMAAAYALGQIGDSTAAPLLAAAFDTSASFLNAKYAILEAVGKCAPASYLSYLATVRNYHPDLPKPAEGLALGIYRFGLRGITSPEATGKMIELLSDTRYHTRVRLMAAHYLARSAEGMEDIDAAPLIALFRQEQDAQIRMALALGLGKTKSPDALAAFTDLWKAEKDYRVRVNILKALSFFDNPEAIALAVKGLNASEPVVSQQAARYFVDRGIPGAAYQYWRWSRDSFPFPTKVLLSKATMRHIPFQADTNRRAYSYLLRTQFLNEKDPYRKAAWLSAIAEEVWNFRFIFRESIRHEHPVVRSAGASALREIAERPDFDRLFGIGRNRVRRELAALLLQALKSDDDGMISEASIALRIPEREFSTLLADSLPRMESILEGLSLPEQLEPYLELQKTISFLQGQPQENTAIAVRRQSIDWNRILIRVPRIAEIQTTRGTIRLKLFPEQAPGSVVNFVNLAEQDFYNGKTFHRVVPNFVIQGGCPRGDGYGSLDYIIRSELPSLHYEDEGMLGMASAGNHTESTQFFITHSATPHLDGNYTLFGQVEEGMEVVKNVTVGDRILSVTIE